MTYQYEPNDIEIAVAEAREESAEQIKELSEKVERLETKNNILTKNVETLKLAFTREYEKNKGK